jgi:hypothetical protein
MTEEIKAETAVVVETPVVAPEAPEVHKPTQQEIQGKKATTKKKIKHYTYAETMAELRRLEKTNGTHSVYYKQLKNTLTFGYNA